MNLFISFSCNGKTVPYAHINQKNVEGKDFEKCRHPSFSRNHYSFSLFIGWSIPQEEKLTLNWKGGFFYTYDYVRVEFSRMRLSERAQSIRNTNVFTFTTLDDQPMDSLEPRIGIYDPREQTERRKEQFVAFFVSWT